jgi:hypothetical protein
MIRTSVLPLVFAVALGLSISSSALEVKEARWGFDGKVVAGKFNILSVLVDEPGPAPFDGEISLSETRGAESTVGAPQVQKVYVTPGTRRWVQFAPFVTTKDKWKLRWGKTGSFTLEEVSTDAPATVLLLDPNSPFSSSAEIRAFAEDLFPTSVVATEGLDQLVDRSRPAVGMRHDAKLSSIGCGAAVSCTSSAARTATRFSTATWRC